MNKNGKKLFAVYGNCQSTKLKRILLNSKDFSDEWEALDIPGMHVMTNEQLASFKGNLKQLSLLIYQNVKRGEFATESILDLLPTNCYRIGIPSLFFNGYNPEIAYLRQSRSQLFYHDRIMIVSCSNILKTLINFVNCYSVITIFQNHFLLIVSMQALRNSKFVRIIKT